MNITNNSLEIAQCIIYTKLFDGTFKKCNRLAFTPMDLEHIRIAKRKNYPFYLEPNRHENGMICQTHQKFILNAPKFNEQTYKLNLNQFQVEQRRDMQEFVDTLLRANEDNETEETEALHERAFDQLYSIPYENIYARFRDYQETFEHDDGNETIKPTGREVKFEHLSATSLRRYKKFFNLPNRSGASSKAQLLEGISEHFESLPIDFVETTASFLNSIHKKSNKLDFPYSGGET